MSQTSSTRKKVKESVIRQMTRLANEFSAVNLSQGFPNEAPPMKVRLALAHAALTGTPVQDGDASETKDENDIHFKSLYRSLSSMSSSGDENNSSSSDILNQYSPPMGRGDLRTGIASHYKRLYQYEADPENITVTLGATEALASALRSLGKPGDKVVVFEPFHELYPSQCNLFYLEASFVTLRATDDNASWAFDSSELESALKEARILILNSPHNPTGMFAFQ